MQTMQLVFYFLDLILHACKILIRCDRFRILIFANKRGPSKVTYSGIKYYGVMDKISLNNTIYLKPENFSYSFWNCDFLPLLLMNFFSFVSSLLVAWCPLWFCSLWKIHIMPLRMHFFIMLLRMHFFRIHQVCYFPLRRTKT